MGQILGIGLMHILMEFYILFSGLSYIKEVETLGINYGQVANNLPPPNRVLDLLNGLKLTKSRIYDTNPQVLTSFANSGIELMVTVENEMLSSLINPQQALNWVNTHIKPYFPATNITGIAVGNEVFTGDDTTLMTYLVPAIISIHAALVRLGLDRFIKVSTPSSQAVLANSYPPSSGCFDSELNEIMSQFMEFLDTTKSPFWINAYPYFAYKDNPTNISLDYVLFNTNQGLIDPYTKLHYDNMLYAQVDAVIFAIARLGFTGIDVWVSETGWPSSGDPNEVGATLENAAIYNKNLMTRQFINEGTPLRPNYRLEVYIFALFNEDMKPGPTSERNYGIFRPDGTMVYNAALLATSSSTASTSSTSSPFISLTSFAIKVKVPGFESLLMCLVFLQMLT